MCVNGKIKHLASLQVLGLIDLFAKTKPFTNNAYRYANAEANWFGEGRYCYVTQYVYSQITL